MAVPASVILRAHSASPPTPITVIRSPPRCIIFTITYAEKETDCACRGPRGGIDCAPRLRPVSTTAQHAARAVPKGRSVRSHVPAAVRGEDRASPGLVGRGGCIEGG